MNADYQRKIRKPESRAPLFESTWLALFLALRQEWLKSRTQAQGTPNARDSFFLRLSRPGPACSPEGLVDRLHIH